MRKRICVSIFATAIMILVSGTVAAAPSFLGTSGGILAPDDTLLGPGQFSANFHALDLATNPTIIGANVGVAENLELGIARFDPDVAGVSGETLLNAKYLLLPETAFRPSLVIGVVDAGGEIDPEDDAGFYVVVGKNLTSFATNIAGEPSQPIKGYVGVGSGIYSGLFAGVDIQFSSKAKIIAEYIKELKLKGAMSEDSIFNAGIRFAITDTLTGDLSLINSEDLGFGISYTRLGL